MSSDMTHQALDHVALTDPDATTREAQPSKFVDRALVIDGDPKERHIQHLASGDGRILVGTWLAEPYAERCHGYPGDELTHIVQGSVTLTDEDGTETRYTPGETFIIRAGWRGIYRVTEPVIKHYVYMSLT